MTRYLYRGVNARLYEAGKGLAPKACGAEFKRPVYFGEGVYYRDGSVYGKSERNATLMHQRDSRKYPTSGMSTTPNYERAVTYATHNGVCGYVYKIDMTFLEAHAVKHFWVDQHTSRPTIPEDQEVILVAADFGPLPKEIIVEVIAVGPHESS